MICNFMPAWSIVMLCLIQLMDNSCMFFRAYLSRSILHQAIKRKMLCKVSHFPKLATWPWRRVTVLCSDKAWTYSTANCTGQQLLYVDWILGAVEVSADQLQVQKWMGWIHNFKWHTVHLGIGSTLQHHLCTVNDHGMCEHLHNGG